MAPGFIDTHTHCDGGLGRLGSNANLNYLRQGVTTVVTGNCGSGTFRVPEYYGNAKCSLFASLSWVVPRRTEMRSARGTGGRTPSPITTTSGSVIG